MPRPAPPPTPPKGEGSGARARRRGLSVSRMDEASLATAEALPAVPRGRDPRSPPQQDSAKRRVANAGRRSVVSDVTAAHYRRTPTPVGTRASHDPRYLRNIAEGGGRGLTNGEIAAATRAWDERVAVDDMTAYACRLSCVTSSEVIFSLFSKLNIAMSDAMRQRIRLLFDTELGSSANVSDFLWLLRCAKDMHTAAEALDMADTDEIVEAFAAAGGNRDGSGVIGTHLIEAIAKEFDVCFDAGTVIPGPAVEVPHGGSDHDASVTPSELLRHADDILLQQSPDPSIVVSVPLSVPDLREALHVAPRDAASTPNALQDSWEPERAAACGLDSAGAPTFGALSASDGALRGAVDAAERSQGAETSTGAGLAASTGLGDNSVRTQSRTEGGRASRGRNARRTGGGAKRRSVAHDPDLALIKERGLDRRLVGLCERSAADRRRIEGPDRGTLLVTGGESAEDLAEITKVPVSDIMRSLADAVNSSASRSVATFRERIAPLMSLSRTTRGRRVDIASLSPTSDPADDVSEASDAASEVRASAMMLGAEGPSSSAGLALTTGFAEHHSAPDIDALSASSSASAASSDVDDDDVGVRADMSATQGPFSVGFAKLNVDDDDDDDGVGERPRSGSAKRRSTKSASVYATRKDGSIVRRSVAGSTRTPGETLHDTHELGGGRIRRQSTFHMASLAKQTNGEKQLATTRDGSPRQRGPRLLVSDAMAARCMSSVPGVVLDCAGGQAPFVEPPAWVRHAHGSDGSGGGGVGASPSQARRRRPSGGLDMREYERVVRGSADDKLQTAYYASPLPKPKDKTPSKGDPNSPAPPHDAAPTAPQRQLQWQQQTAKDAMSELGFLIVPPVTLLSSTRPSAASKDHKGPPPVTADPEN